MAKRGRKSKAEELGLKSLLDECWTEADRKKTIKKLSDLSNRGNMKAIEILMAYTYGKPKEYVEHSGDEASPIHLRIEYINDTPTAPASGTADDQG